MANIKVKKNLRNAIRWSKRTLKKKGVSTHGIRIGHVLFAEVIKAYPDAKATDLIGIYLECRSWVDFKVPKKKRAAYGIECKGETKAHLLRKKNGKTTRKEEYDEYINKSPEWQAKRKEALKISDSCAVCSSKKKLHVHHRKYPKRLGTEPADWLTVLCGSCHMLFHKHGKLSR